MLSAVLSYPDVHSQCSAILNFAGSADDDATRPWARRAVSKVAERARSHSELGHKDGSSLVQAIGEYHGVKGLDEM